MTWLSPEERAERDAAICAYYNAGHRLTECGVKFGIGRQRVQQILQRAGVWHRYVSNRTEFVGVNVSAEAKYRLILKAEEEGMSVSRFVSDCIEEIVSDGH